MTQFRHNSPVVLVTKELHLCPNFRPACLNFFVVSYKTSTDVDQNWGTPGILVDFACSVRVICNSPSPHNV